ncbi:uncharacterized protein AMSG_09955 [Thecamonas trahens ATCC 50062]|uniref:FZ domain-containing protein n=1 Tax=Thecamonas trahens ATCC 50062 TaxID=461836 RepID=A0A0L0DQ74_THETB|nr:hypothetical protein AMSG_09955 [Thecamonas trahens ATCC 50062]KNC54171.1 hypothetical protein AMSG_09955 [Thecamonas trahens ATCC 50062]|eukprot:XP_013753989.1 hypothetical protein AMSG_09955 [Thecamonas trahens ATCC 50062]
MTTAILLLLLLLFRQLLTTADGMQKIMPRTAFSGKVSNRFCGLDENGECQYGPYLQSLGLLIIPPVVFAVLSLLVPCAFFLPRLVLGFWGGRSPSHGWFKPVVRETQFPGYSRTSIVRTKALYVGIAGTMIGVVVAGMLGNMLVSSATSTFVDTVLESAIDVVTTAERVVAEMAGVVYTPAGFQTRVQPALDAAAAVLDSGQTMRDTVQTYSAIRLFVMYGFLGVPLIFAAVGLAGPLLNARKLAFGCSMSATCIMFLTWSIFAIHVLLIVLFSDLCVEIDELRAVDSSAISNATVLNKLLGCGATNSSFDSLVAEAEAGLTAAAAAACSAHALLCTEQYQVCPPTPCSIATIESLLLADVLDFELGCYSAPNPVCTPGGGAASGCPSQLVGPCDAAPMTIRTCAESCRPAGSKAAAAAFVSAADAVAVYQRLLFADIKPLQECSFVTQLFTSVQDTVCVDMLGGLDALGTTLAAEAVLVAVLMVLLILGLKRFRSLADARLLPLDGGDELAVVEHGTDKSLNDEPRGSEADGSETVDTAVATATIAGRSHKRKHKSSKAKSKGKGKGKGKGKPVSRRDRPRPGTTGMPFLVSSYSSDAGDADIHVTVLARDDPVREFVNEGKTDKKAAARLRGKQVRSAPQQAYVIPSPKKQLELEARAKQQQLVAQQFQARAASLQVQATALQRRQAQLTAAARGPVLVAPGAAPMQMSHHPHYPQPPAEFTMTDMSSAPQLRSLAEATNAAYPLAGQQALPPAASYSGGMYPIAGQQALPPAATNSGAYTLAPHPSHLAQPPAASNSGGMYSIAGQQALPPAATNSGAYTLAPHPSHLAQPPAASNSGGMYSIAGQQALPPAATNSGAYTLAPRPSHLAQPPQASNSGGAFFYEEEM